MKNKLFNCLLASIFLISQISFSQTDYDMDPDIVELDEIILSLPFNQDLSSLGNREYLSRENGICWMDECMPEGFYSGLFKKGSCMPNTFSEGLEPISEQRFDTLRIQSGNFSIPDEIGNEDLPQEAGAEKEMVDFNKGCYLGQETMSKIKNVSSLKQEIRVWESMDSNLNLEVEDKNLYTNSSKENSVGKITSIFKSDSHKKGLAMIKRKYLKKERFYSEIFGTIIINKSVGSIFL